MYKRLSNMEKNKIEKRAAKVLEAIGYDGSQDVYVDAVRLARFFGFEVEEKDSLPATEDGCITVTVSEDTTQKCIIVNNARSLEFKRFIIVHELAHYLLHYTKKDTFFMHRENKKGKSLEENDADYLAACLLMPQDSFRKRYTLLKSSGRNLFEITDELQKMYCTPRESIIRRVDEVLH